MPRNLKLVVIGDGAVGKSSLLISYKTNIFPPEYIPTVVFYYSIDVVLEGQPYNVGFWDTAGHEDFDNIRPLSYPQADVFLVCFSVDRPDSLINIKEKWIPEVRRHRPDTPIVMVACKTDLRNQTEDVATQARRFLSYSDGVHFAQSLNVWYSETSALTMHGVKNCIDKAISIGASVADEARRSNGVFSSLFGLRKKKERSRPV